MNHSTKLLQQLCDEKRILFFGGKGGVGKTTISAATALSASASKRVLLVSTDPAHNLGHLFNRSLSAGITRLAPNLDALELDPQQTIEQHLNEVGSTLRRLMPVQLAGEVDKHLELSRDAPGMEEAALLERIAEVVEESSRNYDLVIFDTAPSGHTARLMALPEMMSAWTEGLLKRRDKSDRLQSIVNNLGTDNTQSDKLFGDGKDEQAIDNSNRESMIRTLLNRRQQRFKNLRKALTDADQTAFVIVLAAERLPVLESIELTQRLEKTGVAIGGLVVNKRLPSEDLSPFLQQRRAQENKYFAELQQALAKVPMQEVPMVAQDVVGLEALHQLAETMAR